MTLKTIPRLLVNDWSSLAGGLSVKYGHACVVISFSAVLEAVISVFFSWNDILLLIYCSSEVCSASAGQKRHHLCKTLVVNLSIMRHAGFTQQLVHCDTNINSIVSLKLYFNNIMRNKQNGKIRYFYTDMFSIVSGLQMFLTLHLTKKVGICNLYFHALVHLEILCYFTSITCLIWD